MAIFPRVVPVLPAFFRDVLSGAYSEGMRVARDATSDIRTRVVSNRSEHCWLAFLASGEGADAARMDLEKMVLERTGPGVVTYGANRIR